jgi:hypothetical protein
VVSPRGRLAVDLVRRYQEAVASTASSQDAEIDVHAQEE